ncbi:MAG: hypothetical protein FWF08_06945 [Oscillospiraceae bacterium]|nr:hypothetical protein [Oscillospiraceae bacterium]
MNKKTEEIIGNNSIIQKILKDKKLFLIISLGVIGMAALLISEFSDPAKKQAEETGIMAESDSFADYEDKINKKLADILGAVDGAGRVKVMITIECMEEHIYAKDEKNSASGKDGEKDIKSDFQFVIIQDGKDKTQSGLQLKMLMPVVKGVAVVCDGGDIPVVRQNIAEMASALFGIGVSKVYVSKMQK